MAMLPPNVGGTPQLVTEEGSQEAGVERLAPRTIGLPQLVPFQFHLVMPSGPRAPMMVPAALRAIVPGVEEMYLGKLLLSTPVLRYVMTYWLVVLSQRHTHRWPPSASAFGVVPTLCSVAPMMTRPSLLTWYALPVRYRAVWPEVVLCGVGRSVILPAPPLPCASQTQGRQRKLFALTVVPAVL